MDNRLNYYAFFDVDNTLIGPKSMFSFMRFYCRKTRNISLLGDLEYFLFCLRMSNRKRKGYSREVLNRFYYEFYRGVERSVLDQISQDWFAENLKNSELFFYDSVVKELQFHQKQGATIALVSGSFFSCLDPIAHYLNVHHILATQLEEILGRLTGHLIGNPVIGEGKVDAIHQFIPNQGLIDLSKSYAYGDHHSDIPMLSLVGNPVVVDGGEKMRSYAREKAWRLISV
jgi:HAD superfamily hydrolase (TIGR01490 family)